MSNPESPDIGTGPFQVVRSATGRQLQAFPRYYRGRPAIDDIDVNNYPTPAKRLGGA